MGYSTALCILLAGTVLIDAHSSLPPEVDQSYNTGSSRTSLPKQPAFADKQNQESNKLLAIMGAELSKQMAPADKQIEQFGVLMERMTVALDRHSASMAKQREQSAEFIKQIGTSLEKQLLSMDNYNEQSNEFIRKIGGSLDWRSTIWDKNSDQYNTFLQSMSEYLDKLLSSLDNQSDQYKQFTDKIGVALNLQQTSMTSQMEQVKGFMETIGASTNRQNSKMDMLLKKLNETLGRPMVTLDRDCFDLYQSGHKRSDSYWIRPTGWTNPAGFEVFCDMDTEGGGWTVFQRRGQFGNPQDYFTRTWDEYKRGFGDLKKEFWMGNDRLSSLTSNNSLTYELRVDMADVEKRTAYAKYKEFRVQEEKENYRLTVVSYTGTAGDALSEIKGKMFSTKERDNDGNPHRNVAADLRGGWWYAENPNYYANPNGWNMNGSSNTGYGIAWYHWKHSYQYSMPSMELKVRPKQG